MKQYNLFKTIKKTEMQNNELQLVESRNGGTILVDISHLNKYNNIPIDVITDIKDQLKHLSAANTTLFCGYCKDFEAYDGILKFQCIKVLKDNGCKHCYNIFVLENINRLNYGERTTVYDHYYNENMIEIKEENRIQSIIDIEIA